VVALMAAQTLQGFGREISSPTILQAMFIVLSAMTYSIKNKY
jgi:hypothetical protein